MRVCSLFAGAGGIDIAFEQAGFTTVWANEFDKDACKTYRQNFPNVTLVEKDIRKVDVSVIPDFDILVGGFPCQPFSIAGRQKGFQDDRGNLFFEICRIIDAKQPQALFLENVANLIQHDNGNTFKVVRQQIEQRGYSFSYLTGKAYEYGHPQIRNRIYIVGFKNPKVAAQFSFPQKSKPKIKSWDIVDVSKPLDDRWYLDPGSWQFKEMSKAITDPRLIYRFSDVGIISGKNGIVFTLMAGMGHWPDRIPVVKDGKGIRMITPYECFMLQGFPPQFDLSQTPENSAYRQAGNSVCVPVVKQIVDCMASAIKKVADSEVKNTTPIEDTLVGCLRDNRQLKICLDYKFYHTPVRNIECSPELIKYVAIYQSPRLYGKDAGIRYIGKVDHVVRIPRSEIKEIPKRSGELYYKFSVTEWRHLDYVLTAAKAKSVYVCSHESLKRENK